MTMREIIKNLAEQARTTGKVASYEAPPKGVAPLTSSAPKLTPAQNDTVIDVSFRTVAAPCHSPLLMPMSTAPPLRNEHGIRTLKTKLEMLVQRYDRTGLPALLRCPLRAEFFAALVAYEICTTDEPDKRELCIRALGGSDNDMRTWRTAPPPPADIVSWAVGKLNRSRVMTALVLGEVFGLKPEHCFSSFPTSSIHNAAISTAAVEKIPHHLHGNDIDFTLKAKFRVRNLDGTDSLVLCRYTTGDQELFVVAIRRVTETGTSTVSLGAAPAPAHLFARDLILKNPAAEVWLCTDIRVAMRLTDLAKEGRLVERTGVVVSGFFGGDDAVKAPIASDLAGHNVTILSSPGQDGWESVPVLAKTCVDHGAPQVSLFPWPLVPERGLTYKEPLQPEVARCLHDRQIHLGDVELPSRLAEQVRTMAIPLENLQAWKRQVGLVSPAERENEGKHEPDFALVTFGALPDKVSAAPNSAMSISSMLTPGYTTMIWGFSNAGKSWFAIEVALALATGTPCFFLTASPPAKVVYLDGEVGETDFKERCVQLMGNREGYRPLLDTNLSVVSLWGGQSLLDGKRQDEVLATLKSADTKFVFIDNLFSLAPNAAKANATPFFEFIKRIQAEGIAVIIIHHARKTATDFKGPVELVSLCQNVLHIEGRDQIHTGDTDLLCDALATDGPVARVCVDKCKVAPHFERRHGTYKLPVGKPWEWVEGDLCPVDDNHEIAASAASSTSVHDETNYHRSLSDLTPDQQRVLEVMEKGKSYYRKNIEEISGLKEDRVRKALDALRKAGLVSREGKGKDTHYRRV